MASNIFWNSFSVSSIQLKVISQRIDEVLEEFNLPKYYEVSFCSFMKMQELVIYMKFSYV